MHKQNYMYRRFFKRVFDFIGALILFTLLSPIFIGITILLAITLKSTPFFTQKRPGKHEKIFSVFKFKSMTDKRDSDNKLLSDDLRLTKLGILLRKTSLDEIPQLINVIKGEMSFIGPRPLLIRYLPYYTKKEKVRHSVRPGITGLAQISGRNNLNWDNRLKKDIEYVKNMSFINDLIIVLKTVKKVLLREDINVLAGSENIDLDAYRK